MPPFARFLSDGDVWDVVMHTQKLLPAVSTSAKGGQ
jgi:hypothetical protein